MEDWRLFCAFDSILKMRVRFIAELSSAVTASNTAKSRPDACESREVQQDS